MPGCNREKPCNDDTDVYKPLHECMSCATLFLSSSNRISLLSFKVFVQGLDVFRVLHLSIDSDIYVYVFALLILCLPLGFCLGQTTPARGGQLGRARITYHTR